MLCAFLLPLGPARRAERSLRNMMPQACIAADEDDPSRAPDSRRLRLSGAGGGGHWRSGHISGSGHSRPREPILHAIGCPLRPESDQARAAAQYVAKGQEATWMI